MTAPKHMSSAAFFGLLAVSALAQPGSAEPEPLPRDVMAEMISNQPADPETQKPMQIAALAMGMGQYSVAALAYEEVLGILAQRPDSPSRSRRMSEVHKERAIARYFSDDQDGALTDIDQAIRLEIASRDRVVSVEDLLRVSELRLLKVDALSGIERFDEAVAEIQAGAFELIDFQDANPDLPDATLARVDYQIAGFAASLFWMGQTY